MKVSDFVPNYYDIESERNCNKIINTLKKDKYAIIDNATSDEAGFIIAKIISSVNLKLQDGNFMLLNISQKDDKFIMAAETHHSKNK